jgi:acyl-CoA synthetase (AMP-forming)/AMP-acid ligase II
MNGRVNAICHALMDYGLKKGDRVALVTYNNHQFMELLFACGRVGTIFVPLNFRLVGRELEYQLNHSGAAVLFLGEEFQKVIESIRPRLQSVKKFIAIGKRAPGLEMEVYEDLVATYPQHLPLLPYEVELNDELIILYTSGTTGRPKGALLTQMNVIFNSMNQIIDYPCRRKDVNLVLCPMFHVMGSLQSAFPMIHVGGTSVIMKSFNAARALELMQKEKITITCGVPIMWTSILEVPGVENADFSSLQFCMSGGASQPVAIMKTMLETFHLPITEGYGLSEAICCSSMLPAGYLLEKTGSIGRPFLHNMMRVVNKAGEDVRPGEVGEIVQKGPTVMKGYFNNPEATRETIKDGWLHTGDLATVDEDGFMYIKGRKKDMIISGAENIYPVEVEQVLHAHPKILEAAVIGVPDKKWGESVRAIVVLKEGQRMTPEEVIAYCKENLASYKKPKSVIFMDRLPRNPSGKVLKTELREKFSGPTDK